MEAPYQQEVEHVPPVYLSVSQLLLTLCEYCAVLN